MPALMTSLIGALAAKDSNMAGIFQRDIDGHTSDNDDLYMPYSYSSRTSYFACSCIPLIVLCYLFYRRVRHVRLRDLAGTTYIRGLVYANYITGIAFTIVAMVMIGTGLKTTERCQDAIYVCITFLFLGKAVMQLFLIERAHVANISYLRRRDDPVWKMSMTALVVLGSAITVWTFINPVAYISPDDGHCRKGLPPSVVAPLEAFDIVINTILTIVFISILHRTRRRDVFPEQLVQEPHTLSQIRTKVTHVLYAKEEAAVSPSELASSGGAQAAHGDSAAAAAAAAADNSVVRPPSTRPSRLHGLARKSLLGTLLILMWTIINSAIFYASRGREQAWLCYTQCTLDVVLSVCVIHWLTSDPNHEERTTRDALSSMISRAGSMSVRKPSFGAGLGSVSVQEIDVSQLKDFDSLRKSSTPGAGLKVSFLKHAD